MTQLYYQIYIIYQLYVSAIAAVAIIRMDKIYQRTRSRLHKVGGRVCRW